jgi:hypothetical protein
MGEEIGHERHLSHVAAALQHRVRKRAAKVWQRSRFPSITEDAKDFAEIS